MMDWTQIVTLVVSVMAMVTSVATVILSYLRAQNEAKNMQADTEVKNAEAEVKLSDAALRLIEPYKTRLDEIERQFAQLELARERDKIRITELERRVTELECELREERNAKDEIRVGAERLVHQVESLGGKPVYVPPKRGGTGELKKT